MKSYISKISIKNPILLKYLLVSKFRLLLSPITPYLLFATTNCLKLTMHVHLNSFQLFTNFVLGFRTHRGLKPYSYEILLVSSLTLLSIVTSVGFGFHLFIGAVCGSCMLDGLFDSIFVHFWFNGVL